MKKVIMYGVFILLVFFVAIVSPVFAKEAVQSEGVRIPLTTCGELSVTGAVYSLLNDIGESDFLPGGCFTITSPRVTLDCNEFTIYGGAHVSSAILSDQSETVIRDCSIAMPAVGSYGIHFFNVSSSRVEHTVLIDSFFPVFITQSTHNVFNDLALKRNVRGITLSDSSNNYFNRTLLGDNDYALLLKRSDSNFFENMLVDECSGALGCIVLATSSNNEFLGGVIGGAAQRLVSIEGLGSNDNVFRDMAFADTAGEGIVISGESNLNNQFINVSYDSTVTEVVSLGSELIRSWYLTFFINGSEGTLLEGVLIEGEDNSLYAYSFTGTTNSEGILGPTPVAAYVNDGSVTYMNYVITMTQEGYDSRTDSSLGPITDNAYLAYTLMFLPPQEQSLESESHDGNGKGRCRSDWTCTDWSNCTSGIATRSCSLELAYCLPLYPTKPIESRACNEPINLAAPSSFSSDESPSASQGVFARITGAVIGPGSKANWIGFIGLLVALIGGYMLIVLLRRNRIALAAPASPPKKHSRKKRNL